MRCVVNSPPPPPRTVTRGPWRFAGGPAMRLTPALPSRVASGAEAPSRAWGRLRRAVAAALVLLAGTLLVLQPEGAEAQTAQIVQNDWALKPAEIGGGASFRLLFVTSTRRDGTSSNIGEYNSFVQGRANAGHTAIKGFSSQFRALISTPTVNARDNTATTHTNANRGVPIYWLGVDAMGNFNGAKVADDYADFYDGGWDSNTPTNELGNRFDSVIGPGQVITGSQSDGRGQPGQEAGALDSFGFLVSRINFGGPITQGAELCCSDVNPSSPSRLYALSPVITTAPKVVLSVSPTEVAENATGAVTITVTGTLENSVAFMTSTAVTVAVGGGTATEGTDYATVEDFTLTIAAGSRTGTATFSLDPTDDAEAEGNETVTVTGTATGLTVDAASVTITDDDASPAGAVTLALNPTAAGESADATTVTVTATLPGSTTRSTDTALTVSVGASGDAATEGTDYATVDDFTLTIAAGSRTGTATFSIDPTQDVLDEGTGEAVSITATTTVSGLTVTGATFTITDDDASPAGTVTLALDPTAADESADATNVTVTATLPGSTTRSTDTALTVSVGASGDAATEGTDYTTVDDFTLTIPANSQTGTATFSIDPTQDVLDEGTGEAVSVTATTTVSGLTVTGATFTITDDDASPAGTVTLALNPTAADESADATNVTVTATLPGSTTRSTDTALTVSVGASGDAATEGTDYATVDDFTLTIPAGSRTGTATFSIDPAQDMLDEGTGEAVSVTATTTVSGLTVTGATFTITDDDASPAGTVTLALNPTAAGESADATNVTVTATLPGSTTRSTDTALTVSVGASGDAATEGTDYATVDDFTLTIAAGSRTGSATFSIDPTQDMLDEGTGEAVSVTGATTVSGLTVTGATFTITDDDTAPTKVVLSVAPSKVAEGATTAATVTVTGTLEGNVALATTTTVTVSVGSGTATAGTDFAAVTGFTLTIPANSPKGTATFSLDPTDDAEAEGDETVAVTGTAAGLTVDAASVTIIDDDTVTVSVVPWVARFGRTVADQAIEAAQARMAPPRQAAWEVTLGGQPVPLDGAAQCSEAARETEAAAAARGRAAALDRLQGMEDPEERCRRELETRMQGMDERELLQGSSFSFAAGDGGSAYYTLWGRGAVSRFDGRGGNLALDGEVASAFLGVDWSRERTTLGLILGHSAGDGGYASETDSGAVSATLTGLWPWVHHALTDRLSLWGVAGYGAGTITMTPANADGTGQAAFRADLDLMVAAAGFRNTLVEVPETGGFELAVKADAMAVRTRSAAASGAGGNLAGATAEVTRLRLGLEGTWPGIETEGGARLTPTLELGLRQDDGDAETGFGVEVGAGIAWSDPASGVEVDFRVRGLLAHDEGGFRERGLSGSVVWDPEPGSDRGPSLTLTQTLVVSARDGVDALFRASAPADIAANGNRLDARSFGASFGYGFGAFGDRFTLTPEFDFGLSDTGRDYRVGWRLNPSGSHRSSFELRLNGTRSEPANGNGPAGEPEHSVGIELRTTW